MITRAQLEALQLKHGPGEISEVINTLLELATALAEAEPGEAARATERNAEWWHSVRDEARELRRQYPRQRIREKLGAKLAEKRAAAAQPMANPPRYDEVWAEGMRRLEEEP